MRDAELRPVIPAGVLQAGTELQRLQRRAPANGGMPVRGVQPGRAIATHQQHAPAGEIDRRTPVACVIHREVGQSRARLAAAAARVDVRLVRRAVQRAELDAEVVDEGFGLRAVPEPGRGTRHIA
jgi:hypothetical protein